MRLRLSRERSRGHGQSSSWDQAAQGPADQGMALLFTGVRCRGRETVTVQGGSSREIRDVVLSKTNCLWMELHFAL